MLTRLLFAVGLCLIVLALVGRTWLALAASPRADIRITLRGEDLLAGLEDPLLSTPNSAVPVTTATPSPSPTSPLLPQSTSGCFTYTAQAGDTPPTLARRFDTGVAAILRDNQLTATSQIMVGQRLIICAGPGGQAPPPASLERAYRVRPEDTLSSIAVRFGVSVLALAQVNGMSVSTRPYVGQVLRLPDLAPFPVTTPRPVSTTGLAATATVSPTAQPSTSRGPIPLPTEVLRLDWPRQVSLGRSDVIRVSLGRATEQVARETLKWMQSGVMTATVVAATLPVLRTNRALAAEYEGVAVGRLAADGFDLYPLLADHQPLTSETLAWAWNISPTQPGRYVTLASIEIQWFPRAGGPPIDYVLGQYEMAIDVVQPWITPVQYNWLGLLGSILLVSAMGLLLRQRLAGTAQPSIRRF